MCFYNLPPLYRSPPVLPYFLLPIQLPLTMTIVRHISRIHALMVLLCVPLDLAPDTFRFARLSELGV
jgi:hypothetical protein